MRGTRFGSFRVAAVVVVALATGLSAAPVAQGQQQVPGQFENLTHVFNFRPPSPPVQANRRASDLEFYTAVVPNRDYSTGQLLDETGNPLPPGAPPVMVTRDFSIMGSYLGGAWVFDITDPEAIRFVANIPCNQTQNDVQIKRFGDLWLLALARDGAAQPCVSPAFGAAAGAGIAVFDVSDPFEFEPMYSFRNAGGAHNFTFHPTKPFGWVSTGDLPGGLNHIPIIDFSDVDNPMLAADIAVQGGPHDVSFSSNGNRAYVASENNLRIYDTTNPAAPVLISVSPNLGTYSHGLDPTPDGKLMVHTNESLALGGFFVGGTSICPGEGLTFYNIEGSLERTPVPVGYFVAENVGPSTAPRACTGHVGEIAPNSSVLVTGWYRAGVRLVDFSNPSLPREIGSAMIDGAEVWAAKFHKGPYIYASDTQRGFDVFRWTGEGPAPWLPEADLSLSKSDSPDPVTVGDPLTYSLEVANAGPNDATGVTVTDTLPAGVSFDGASDGCTETDGTVTCQLGTVAAGDTAQVEITVVPQEPGDHTNSASVSSDATDPNPDDNSATATTTAVCTITGTGGADNLKGTAGRDVICGLGGDDELRGLGGDDLLLGGEGNDRLLGQDGDDDLRGGPGNDELNGGEGDDMLSGGTGTDTLNGGPGRDSCSDEDGGGTVRECEG